MSQILTNLILSELQQISPNPITLNEQRKLAKAIAKAVSTYINTPGNIVIYTAPVGLLPTPVTTTGVVVGTVTPPLLIKAI